MISWLEVIPPTNGDLKLQRLWEALAGDDLTAILKGHLQIEGLLESLIVKHMPKAEVLFDESFLFMKKIGTLRRLNAITKEVAGQLQAINEIRNRFGHDPTLRRFDADHWNIVKKHFPAVALDAISGMIKHSAMQFVSIESLATPMRLAIYLTYVSVGAFG